MRFVKSLTLALAAVGLTIVAVPSCNDDTLVDGDCEYAVRRCRTFCDYGYGCSYYWGCCYDQCWYECIQWRVEEPPPPPASNPPPAADASTPPPETDASPDGGSGFAVLCAPCTSNDDCAGGGLCIIRGGEDAGASGFCGSPCAADTECPADFTCTQIGSSKQCVPANGTCS